jgi:peptide deformylase
MVRLGGNFSIMLMVHYEGTAQALNSEGRRLNYAMEGFEARAVQHEIDHLDGLLFLDRLVSRRSSLFLRKIYK